MFKNRTNLAAVAAVLVFVAVGVTLLSLSNAATPFMAIEPEDGTRGGSVQVITDASVSGGADVQFTAAGPSGQAMPVGDLPGWQQITAEDFTQEATSATFDATHADSWRGYTDGSGGKYFKSVISAHDGVMDMTLDGSEKGAAGCFGPTTGTPICPMTYGRFSMRIKVMGAAGYGSAVMVWPNSGVWGDGEIDYPEGDFDGTMHVFHHGVGCGNACGAADGFDTGAAWTSWHTVTTEWTPSSVKYYMDGVLVKTVTHDIPTTSHRYTIQVGRNTTPAASGHVNIDWVTVYKYAP